MWPNKWNINQCTCWKGTLLFLPSGCFILAIKVTNFKNQISVQNCLDWLGKERKKKKKESIFQSYIQETFAEILDNLHYQLVHSTLCIW